MPFSNLGLFSSLVRGAQAMGYIEATPIQARAIPAVLAGRDLIASAQTGTGKTAAFALPALNRLGPHRAAGPRVLVLEPTRELAAQVAAAFVQLGRFTDAKILVLHGGVSLGPQRNALRSGADVIIATVGRLREFLDAKMLRLDLVEVLILDEVDRMLDLGFIDEVKTIVRSCPPARQTLLFSATLPPRLEEVASFALREPLRIEISREQPVTTTVNHAIHTVAATQKFELLLALLRRAEFSSVIIFTRTKLGADHIAHCLRLENHAVAVLHADRSQPQRASALAEFKGGRKGVLVATNIAARGIDVAGVSHVINYDVPQDPEDYVHRIGRTGRAQESGEALMLATPEEAGGVHAIEKLINQEIPRRVLDGFIYEGGQPPLVDSSKPSAVRHRPGRQRLGAGGQSRGDAGQNQSRARGGPAFGGGNPSYHSKGKPGAHWRKREGTLRSMAHLGKRSDLFVVRAAIPGVYLDGGELGEILLPRRYVPRGIVAGQSIEVFIYRDSEDRLVATTESPHGMVGEFASLQVIATDPRRGAFLDWGLSKDLLLPIREQERRVEVGQRVVVHIFVDKRSDRIVASSRLNRHLNRTPAKYAENQPVRLLVVGPTPLGYQAIIESAHLGLLYHSELPAPIEIGQRLDGYVRAVRPDGKIDLTLNAAGHRRVAPVKDRILEALKQAGGELPFGDASSPEQIWNEFACSKKAFKQAIGALYRERRIVIEDRGIRSA